MARGDEIWQETRRTVKGDYKLFHAIEVTSRGPHGKEGRFIVLDPPDWAVVIPVMEREGQRHLLTVRQYRHGTRQVLTEFPGGVVEPGEAPEAAAARELLEETGYRAGTIIHLGSCSPNPAFMSNTFHIFAATELALVAEQSLDEHELVDVHEAPEAEILSAVGDPPWTHALMATAAWYYRRWREAQV